MNKFMLSDEDADFLPIIPINENDDQDKNLVIPDILPLLPFKKYSAFSGCCITHNRWQG